MNRADLLINQVLEAAEVGDDGVTLKKIDFEKNYDEDPDKTHYLFHVMHPVHGKIGSLEGVLHGDDYMDIKWLDFEKHPKYQEYDKENYKAKNPLSRTLVKAGLRELMRHFPKLETVTGYRVTGTHSRGVSGDDTEVNIPKYLRKS
jgi:hypothetical protein